MSPTLIFITGAPGVGKTTVARALLPRLADSAWLGGDDVWRMHPFRVDATTTAMVESNIAFVLRNYLESGFSHVILSWVLHKQDIIGRIVEALKGIDYRFLGFTLVCGEADLMARLARDPSRDTNTELAMVRLKESLELNTMKIDTSGKSIETIVHEITGYVLVDQVTENS